MAMAVGLALHVPRAGHGAETSPPDLCDPDVGSTFNFSGTIAPKGAGLGIRTRNGVVLLDVRPVGCGSANNRYEVAVKMAIASACIPNARVRGSGKVLSKGIEPVQVRVYRIETDSIAC